MGLDMYLVRKKYIGAEYEHRNVKGTIYITIGDKQIPIDFNRIVYIDEKVGYWRKANAIHKWFVDNVQHGVDNCQSYYVSAERLEELLNLCKKVKKTAIIKRGQIQNGSKLENGKWEPIMEEGDYIENAEEIEKLLPTTDGCFFGSTNYDEWYMQDIDYTIKMLGQILREEKKLNEQGFYSDFEYSSSW